MVRHRAAFIIDVAARVLHISTRSQTLDKQRQSCRPHRMSSKPFSPGHSSSNANATKVLTSRPKRVIISDTYETAPLHNAMQCSNSHARNSYLAVLAGHYTSHQSRADEYGATANTSIAALQEQAGKSDDKAIKEIRTTQLRYTR